MVEDSPALTIGEVARRAGIATSAIRFYETVGLLPEPLRISGQRRYSEDVLGRLAFIAAAQSAGFTLREVQELMARADEEGELSGPMQALSQRKLPEVQAAIERAEQMKAWLEAARGCDCSSPEECSLFPQPGEPAEPLQITQVGGSCQRALT
jgi:MerR family transcriptional regulator, redox-sensitive transcriptional activator SoxR